MKNKRKKAAAIYAIVVFSSLFLTLNAQNVVSEADSLEQILKTGSPEGAKLLDIYWDLSWHYLRVDDYEKMKEYADKGVVLAEKTGNLYILADLYHLTGVAYDYVSKMDSAMLYFGKALETVAQMEKSAVENPERIARVKGFIYGSMANLYSVHGKSVEALPCYFKALDLFEKYHIDNETANILGNIGATYLDIDNYEQAEIYLLKKEKICRRIGNQPNLAHALTGLGYIYLYKKDYAKARVATEEAITLYEHNEPRPADLLSCHQCLSSVYLMETGDDAKAMEYAHLALQEAEALEIPLERCRSLLLKSEIHLFRKNYAAAEKMALEALQADSTHLASNQTLYECIIKANIGMRNVERATAWFDRYKQSLIAYANINFQSQLSEMEIKYETEKKEMQIATLEDEKRMMIWLGISGGTVLLLALAASILLWRWTVQKKRLAESQKELAEQQIKQFEQEKTLIATQAMFDGEIKERIRLARDLHDRLGGMLSAMKLSLADMKKNIMPDQDSLEVYNNTMELLDESMLEMRRIAHHLMPDALARSGLKMAISEFCKSIPNAKFAWYGENASLDSKLELVVYRIAYELINNAIKHANASRILVQIVRDADRIALTVQDNGCGFDTKITGEGMGLSNIRAHVASSNGVMDIGSVIGEGTEINVELKIEI